MTRRKVLENHGVLKALEGDFETKFTYGVAKNVQKLESEVTAINKAKEPLKEYRKYQKELNELYSEHPLKDDKGHVIKIDQKGGMAVDFANTELQDKMKVLQKKHKKAIDAQDEKLDKDREFLGEEVEIQHYEMSIKCFPKKLPIKVMCCLESMVKESEADIEKYLDEMDG